MGRIEIDRAGYVKQLEGKDKSWILYELLQNAWDEADVTLVTVVIEPVEHKHQIRIVVTDDAPKGFRRLADAYTMWTESLKVDDASMRGRFNEGDKKVILFSERAEIVTTTGTILFEGDERHETRAHLDKGSRITVEFKGTLAEMTGIVTASKLLLPPGQIKTVINGEQLAYRTPAKTTEWTLPTVIGSDLRPSQRRTEVCIYNPQPGETPTLYESGIPVVETADKFHVNILQRVPLNRERDNVPPPYLRLVRAFTLNEMHTQLAPEDFTKPWVAQAVTDKHVEVLAVKSYLDAKYGQERVVHDPTSPESGSRALAAGFSMVYGRQEAKETWDKIRQGGLIPSAGQAFPIGVDHIEKYLDEEDWTPHIRQIVEYSRALSIKLGVPMKRIRVANDTKLTMLACCGNGSLTFNVARLGYAWFENGPTEAVNDILIHEFAHDRGGSDNHLCDAYYNALTRLGAKLTYLALSEPEFFKKYGWKP